MLKNLRYCNDLVFSCYMYNLFATQETISHAKEGPDGARSPYLVDDQEGTRAPICRSRCREFKGRDDYSRREGAPRRQKGFREALTTLAASAGCRDRGGSTTFFARRQRVGEEERPRERRSRDRSYKL